MFFMTVVVAIGLLNHFENNAALRQYHEAQLKAVRVTTVAEGLGGSDEIPFPPEKANLAIWHTLKQENSFERLMYLAAWLCEHGALPNSPSEKPEDELVFKEFLKNQGISKRKFLESKKSWQERCFVHIASRRDQNTYYSPREFDKILDPAPELELAGNALGSAVSLANECKKIASKLKFHLSSNLEENIKNARNIQYWQDECETLAVIYDAAKKAFETQKVLAILTV
jgi:hypothetical protein